MQKIAGTGGNDRDAANPAAEAWHLRSFFRKQQLVRDRVAGVVLGQPGLIVHGAGGTGKTYVVQQELERLNARYRLWNSHLTAFSLFAVLEQYPDHIHILDDLEELLRDRTALGVARSATWPSRRGRDGNPERVVTWSSRGRTREFVFRGGIILISNRPLNSMPELQALATRLTPVELAVTDQEAAAFMRRAAAQGYRVGDQLLLGPEECAEVAEFIIRQSARLGRRLNLRLLQHGYADRIQADDHAAGLDWQDLVASRIAGEPSIVGSIQPVGIRAQRKTKELAVAREIVAMEPAIRLQRWMDETGKSQAALYRRLAELSKLDAQQFEN